MQIHWRPPWILTAVYCYVCSLPLTTEAKNSFLAAVSTFTPHWGLGGTWLRLSHGSFLLFSADRAGCYPHHHGGQHRNLHHQYYCGTYAGGRPEWVQKVGVLGQAFCPPGLLLASKPLSSHEGVLGSLLWTSRVQPARAGNPRWWKSTSWSVEPEQ